MSDDPRTLREAGLAIEGLRNSIAAEIGGLSKLVQWTTGIGALVAAFYGYQLYSLNYNVGSLANAVKTTQEQMAAIRTEMVGLRTETKAELGAIRAELTAIRVALKAPAPEPTKIDSPEKQGNLSPIQSNDGGEKYTVDVMPGGFEAPTPSVLKGQ